jgi:AcrR family transcriptional regulator
VLAFQCPREPTAQRATFYRHFESKNALVLAYFENRDQALWHYLSHPTPPKNLREALTKFEQMANWPEIICCPFLRIASEYPDTAHPYHRLAIEHQNKILDYLTDLLKRCAIDKRAAAAILSVIDGAFSPFRMLYGHSKVVPILSPAEAVLKSFQSARVQRRCLAVTMEASSPHRHSTPGMAQWRLPRSSKHSGTILCGICSEHGLGMLNYSEPRSQGFT